MNPVEIKSFILHWKKMLQVAGYTLQGLEVVFPET
jgi:hypothetical protein